MPIQHPTQSSNLLEVLEKILDKGVVIAGDIKISLADVDLLTIKIRLLVASVDKAREIGMNWWEHDPYYSSRGRIAEEENAQLLERIDRLEHLIEAKALPQEVEGQMSIIEPVEEKKLLLPVEKEPLTSMKKSEEKEFLQEVLEERYVKKASENHSSGTVAEKLSEKHSVPKQSQKQDKSQDKNKYEKKHGKRKPPEKH